MMHAGSRPDLCGGHTARSARHSVQLAAEQHFMAGLHGRVLLIRQPIRDLAHGSILHSQNGGICFDIPSCALIDIVRDVRCSPGNRTEFNVPKPKQRCARRTPLGSS